MAERMLSDFDLAYGLESISFCYFNAAGADPEGDIGEWHTPETHLISLVLDVAAGRRETVQIYGTDYTTPDGICIRDYIHMTDIAMAHVLGLKYLMAEEASGVFNLGNGTGFSVREVVRTVEEVTSRKVRVIETVRKFPGLQSIVETAWKWHRRLAGI
jgi:UDP-glucose 4-epimerase